MNKVLTKVLPVAVVCICLMALYYRIHPFTPKVIIHDKIFYLEVAATDAEKEKGLGERQSLDSNRGMIFPYDRQDYFPFWMKGMNFPLDFLWINGNIIVDISKNIPVMTDNKITTIRSQKKADKIIEFNAGFADLNEIRIGDTVLFKN